MSWRACSVPPVMRWADQAVIQPNIMLSMVHMSKFVMVLGAKPNFFSILRLIY